MAKPILSEVLHPIIFVHTFPLGFGFSLTLIQRIPSKRFTGMSFHRDWARCKNDFESSFRFQFKVY